MLTACVSSPTTEIPRVARQLVSKAQHVAHLFLILYTAAASAAAAPATAAAAAAAADASHGSWVVSCTSHQRRQCLDSAYILSYAGDAKHHPRTEAQICFQTFRASLNRAVEHKKLETLFATTFVM